LLNYELSHEDLWKNGGKTPGILVSAPDAKIKTLYSWCPSNGLDVWENMDWFSVGKWLLTNTVKYEALTINQAAATNMNRDCVADLALG